MMNQNKEKIERYRKVFTNSMHYYGFIESDRMNFYSTQFGDIEPSIQKVIDFVDTYRHNNVFLFDIKNPDNYAKHREDIEIYATACLPFMIAKFKIKNPDVEDRAYKNKMLDFLKFIKYDRGMANYLIHSITSDDSISVIADIRLDKQIEIYEWMLSVKRTTKRENWSGVLQFEYFARIVDIAFDSLKMKLDFLYEFFSEFYLDINPEVIEKQMLIAARNNPLISFSKEHIQKILAHPDNDHTEEHLKNKILNPITDLLL